MSQQNFLIFYVENPTVSAAFYAKLLGKQPVEASPTFALFALDNGLMLGLWSRATVAPPAPSLTGGCELAFTVAQAAEVDSRHAQWVAMGIPIAQAPTQMDFGYTCVGLDPDQHRLRVFSPS